MTTEIDPFVQAATETAAKEKDIVFAHELIANAGDDESIRDYASKSAQTINKAVARSAKEAASSAVSAIAEQLRSEMAEKIKSIEETAASAIQGSIYDRVDLALPADVPNINKITQDEDFNTLYDSDYGDTGFTNKDVINRHLKNGDVKKSAQFIADLWRKAHPPKEDTAKAVMPPSMTTETKTDTTVKWTRNKETARQLKEKGYIDI